ncbi:phosphoglycolate phosphatase [Aquabacterium sp. J223]|uniref:phosphoglycolate phosphatase n=1 Tax=Aquabacterium sp. J223 TaxID=2898431 RepID=UPI0021AD5383|nr:phosphoglycolate phosphatase [Aquabacterium sp. J223]UUX97528.1 phosphoglycolate phosphatase [Aquabacterium sp. J223]
MGPGPSPIQAVLFDLDGTLIDSAPDLAAAANAMRTRRGLPPLPYPRLRPMVGTGARGMVGAAFGLAPGDEHFDALKDEFLATYADGLLQATGVFADMRPVLQALDERGLPWGIVTNKVERFTRPIVAGLGLDDRAAVLVCGDTMPRAKPHPDPLLEAARRLGVPPAACVYVGDDLRDVQAGRAAGMATLAAAWGYLGEAEPIGAWGADAVLERPHALLQWLRMP